MPGLTLKNIPEELYQRLRESARLNRRSLNIEAIVLLERGLGRKRRGVEETLAALKGLHDRLKDQPPLDDKLLRAAKKHGRP
jgi:plasmid stability protein